MTPLEPWIGSFFFKSTLFLQISCLYIYDLPMTPIFLFYYYIVSILSNQDDSLQITICSTDTFIFCSLSYKQSIKQYNFTTLYYFFNNSNKQTTFFKLCFYFSHHLTEQESKQSFSSIQSNPFSFSSLYHCLFVIKKPRFPL